MKAASPEKIIPGVSPLGAWAFALGTSIGWGSLVVTSNTYLAQAGPWGSVLGLLLGTVILPRVHSDQRSVILDKVNKAREELRNGENGVPIRLNIGLAFGDSTGSYAELYQNADLALSRAEQA